MQKFVKFVQFCLIYFLALICIKAFSEDMLYPNTFGKLHEKIQSGVLQGESESKNEEGRRLQQEVYYSNGYITALWYPTSNCSSNPYRATGLYAGYCYYNTLLIGQRFNYYKFQISAKCNKIKYSQFYDSQCTNSSAKDLFLNVSEVINSAASCQKVSQAGSIRSKCSISPYVPFYFLKAPYFTSILYSDQTPAPTCKTPFYYLMTTANTCVYVKTNLSTIPATSQYYHTSNGINTLYMYQNMSICYNNVKKNNLATNTIAKVNAPLVLCNNVPNVFRYLENQNVISNAQYSSNSLYIANNAYLSFNTNIIVILVSICIYIYNF